MKYLKHRSQLLIVIVVALSVVSGACAKKTPPIVKPAPPPSTGSSSTPPPSPPQPVSEPTVVPPMPVPEDTIGSKSLDDLNRDSPLAPVFFELDSSEISSAGQAVLQQNAGVMKQYGSWQITIEGHAHERGSAEYNLALGERRALAARDYLVSLGIPATRVRTVSYGKEFPFDPARNEAAYAKNRRAHFVITAK